MDLVQSTNTNSLADVDMTSDGGYQKSDMSVKKNLLLLP
jgi:hypothetical protein